ncbi:MAG: DUF5343 domain-containing protein [Actinomycetota bacterium]|nr:DUF5343 domain-containing protein [Actinomycetota bacterium]
MSSIELADAYASAVTWSSYDVMHTNEMERAMADAPSYSTVPGRIPELLKRIRETGVPQKVTYEWLKSVGFTSSNDRSLVAVLRQIGFIDGSGAPTPAWREYRGAEHRQVLGRAVALGYETLYATYPDAHNRSNADLGNFFSTKTSAGKQAVDKMVTTFKNLAKEADFSAGVPSARPASADSSAGNGALGSPNGSPFPPAVTGTAGAGAAAGTSAELLTRTHTGAGVTINVNVQLTLPETTDEKVFDAFFRAMRKHLIDDTAS